MKKFVLLFGITLLLFACHSKQEAPANNKTANQIKIIKWYKNISYISNTHPDSIAFYADLIEKLAEHESNIYKSMAYTVRGVYYQNSSSYELSKRAFEKSIALIADSKYDTIQAKAYIGLGNYYKNTGDYPKGFECLYKALKIYEKKKNKFGISSAQGCIAQIYLQKNDLDAAKETLKVALAVLGEDKDNHIYLISSHTLANVYGMSGNFERALAIDEECLAIANKLKSPRNKVMFLDNKANCFMYSNQLDSAAYYFQECLKIDRQVGERKQIADTYTNLGNLAIFQKDYAAAEKHLNTSISLLKELNQKPNLINAYEILVDLYQREGKLKEALAAEFEKENTYQAVISEKKEAALAEFKILYETQKKEQQLAESKVLLLQNEAKTRRTNYVLIALSIVVFFVALVGYLLYRQQKAKVEQKEKEFELKSAIALIEKQNELQEQRLSISRDLHDNIGAQLTFIISSVDNIKYAFEIQNEKLDSKLQNISNFTKSTIIELRDTIWAMNSDEITFEDLRSRILNFIEKAKTAKEDVDFQFTIDDNLNQLRLNSVFGMNIYRVIQEAVNNALKYSNAKQIEILVYKVENNLAVKISDNGVGFDLENTVKGNGIMNMEKRIESIGGIISIDSKVNEGTIVSFLIPDNTVEK
ncbi:MAG: tetratricopeptide repeat protein [Flavobacterium sp.]|nr:tetratricopeptide repeat protein [Flavobacterium sp.]